MSQVDNATKLYQLVSEFQTLSAAYKHKANRIKPRGSQLIKLTLIHMRHRYFCWNVSSENEHQLYNKIYLPLISPDKRLWNSALYMSWLFRVQFYTKQSNPHRYPPKAATHLNEIVWSESWHEQVRYVTRRLSVGQI